ncbi:hypothetical protein [uncultured Croceitalea sp.]|uniref:hypothetical protein n=1 Tax=uncultured Croceitalea sp. TaxID=1798908 RepID=UPI003305F9F3
MGNRIVALQFQIDFKNELLKLFKYLDIPFKETNGKNYLRISLKEPIELSFLHSGNKNKKLRIYFKNECDNMLAVKESEHLKILRNDSFELYQYDTNLEIYVDRTT